MVIPSSSHRTGRRRGALNADLMFALGILMVAVIPLGGSWFAEQKLLRAHYQRSVAMQIVDGEMEILAAGAWQAIGEGTREFLVTAGAATNLPPGRFTITRTNQVLRLEWSPVKRGHGMPVVREVRLP